MSQFNPHSLESAPAESRPALEAVKKSLGMIPNLFGNLAESPATLKGYLALSEQFGASGLDASEQQIVALTRYLA